MFDELETLYGNQLEYVAGGSGQNTMRVAQWFIQKSKAFTYMGCVGTDKYAEILKSKALEVGVNPVYQYNDKEPTGRCAVCIFDHHRSLCAHLAAANHFTESHLNVPENWNLVTKAQYYYITGFHLTVCPPAIMKVAKHAFEENKIFSMNLSAEFICSIFKTPQLAAYEYVDILFGNEAEALVFAKENKLTGQTIPEIALEMADMAKVNEKRTRMVVITRGADEIVVAKDKHITEFPVPRLAKKDIVDTNGAGDAFVGGFLSQLVQEKPLEKCIEAGIFAARTIIQSSGCTFPPVCDYQG